MNPKPNQPQPGKNPDSEENRWRNSVALLEAAAAISGKLELEQVVEETARQIVNLMGADACGISRWDPLANTVTLWAEYSTNGEALISDWRQPADLADYPRT
ncbi:MAG: hypothetical protein OEZ02_13195, partial [Anaerolineae bacterium]|nr:hypothetical protein [Anaerolineae bacterium]